MPVCKPNTRQTRVHTHKLVLLIPPGSTFEADDCHVQDVDVPRLWSQLLAARLQQPAKSNGASDAMSIDVEPGVQLLLNWALPFLHSCRSCQHV